MIRLVHRAGMGALFALGLASAIAAADDSTSKRVWLLKLEYDRPHRVTIGHEPNIENYWYLPFQLVNEDKDDHSFFLEVTAESDKDFHYRNLAHPIVKEIVRRKLGVRDGGRLWGADDLTTKHETTDVKAPFPRHLDLPVIKGGDRVQCVAIFHGPDPEADKIDVMFKGLTNDVIITKGDKPNERKISERALVLHYERPGDEFYRSEDPITFLSRDWVNVERVIKTDLD